ncbi:hypothetical protein EYF80_056495 [Liparis tanakae]|uniref:Uncharacterized protein n=1 Tax=Liparis tanakae TaxID=230148 RepID=A0A4Z2EYC6_9TELE|nr:hypothetical protein EYF80_056495 [Liparis tanakae]
MSHRLIAYIITSNRVASKTDTKINTRFQRRCKRSSARLSWSLSGKHSMWLWEYEGRGSAMEDILFAGLAVAERVPAGASGGAPR